MTKRERRKRPGLPPPRVQMLVAWRQLGPPFSKFVGWAGPLGQHLTAAKAMLADKIGCAVDDLQLDHDPMLRVRKYKPRPGKPVASWYTPHAHDPDHLKWRSKRPQDPDSHKVKTYVRGDNGQHSDTALANRERARERNPDKWKGLRGPKKTKTRRPTTKFPKRPFQVKPGAKIPSRPLRSASRLPGKGQRPFRRGDRKC